MQVQSIFRIGVVMHAIGFNMTHVRGEKNTSKINIPALCVKCDFCSDDKCFCCGGYSPQNCYKLQSECIKQCH